MPINTTESNPLGGQALMTQDSKPFVRDEVAEARANAEIAADCKILGYSIAGPWDLIGYHAKYELKRDIAEVFAKHLAKPHPDMVLQGLIFAGARPRTRDLFLDPVLHILRKRSDDMIAQTAANGLMRMATREDIPLLADLIRDERIGVSRSLLIGVFAKLAKHAAIPVLRLMTSDPVVKSNALKELSKLGDQSIRDELQVLAQHPDSYHRKVARDAIARLDKKAELKLH